MNLGNHLLPLAIALAIYGAGTMLDPHHACIAQKAAINGERSVPATGTNQLHNDKLGSNTPMNLGAFSISLAVKDIHASKAFYEKLGFTTFGGNIDQNWLIMKNGDHIIGLFQGMFEKNILTFNPGWDQNAKELSSFTDVRELQRQLKSQGVQIMTEADESTTGPASLIVVDPDGNPVLLDQHR